MANDIENKKAFKNVESPRYASASKADVEALWAKCGRERVKGLDGFRKMTIAAIEAKLGSSKVA